MRSVTITTHRAINYGAVLQSYALQKAHESLGIDNVLLDVPETTSIYEKLNFHNLRSLVAGSLINFTTFFNQKKSKKLLNDFNNFVKNRIKTTERIYTDIKDVNENLPKTDFFICGSDQVFGLRGPQDDIRIINFGPSDMLRFSYAASLGEYDWNDEEKERAKDILKKYKKISVRENFAKDYLESFIERECVVNIDPVFLLSKEDWRKIEKKPDINEKYILCYNLISNVNMQKTLNLVKNKYGYKVVCLQTYPMKRLKADKYIFDAGPEEFLGWLDNAEAIVTTSFHGTAFSAIFEKPFYTLIKNYKSQRITDLLNLFGLSERVIRDTDKEISIDINVDFSYCREKISEERDKSFQYLNDIIAYVEKNKEDRE